MVLASLPPPSADALIGRERDISALAHLLREGTPWVMLHGPAGVGKTRLATEIARVTRDEWDDVVACDASAVRSDTELAAMLQDAIGVSGVGTDDSDAKWSSVIAAFRSQGRVLCSIDGLDVLLPGMAPRFARLAADCPELCVLSTGSQVEAGATYVVFEVRPLPTVADDGQPSLAASLLFARCLAISPNLISDHSRSQVLIDDANRVAGKLSGLPRLIEDFASRLRSVGWDALVAEVQGGHFAPARAFAGSVSELLPTLDEGDRLLLVLCSVFPSTFTFAQIERLASGQVSDVAARVARLQDMSLVVSAPRSEIVGAGARRLHLLDAVRSAIENESSYAQRLQAARAEFADAMFESWWAAADDWLLEGSPAGLAALRAERANLRVAQEGGAQQEAAAIDHLLAILDLQDDPARAARRFDERALTPSSGGLQPPRSIDVLIRARVALACGDEPGLSRALERLRGESDELVQVHARLLDARLALSRGQTEAAQVAAREVENRALDLGHRYAEAQASLCVAEVAGRAGDYGLVERQSRIAAMIGQELSNAWLENEARLLQGAAQLRSGASAQAHEVFARACECARAVRYVHGEVLGLCGQACALTALGRAEQAMASLHLADSRRRSTQLFPPPVARLSQALAAHANGEAERAMDLLAVAAREARQVFQPYYGALVEYIRMRLEGSESVRDAPSSGIAPPLLGGLLEAFAIPIPDISKTMTPLVVFLQPPPTTSKADDELPTLGVSQDGRDLRFPDGARKHLPRDSPLSLLVLGFAWSRLRDPGKALSVEELASIGWPNERILPRAAKNRVYMALSRLRAAGFRELILRSEDGYFLDPTTSVALEGAPGATHA